MVKKLFKHEFLAYARIMSVVYIILLSIATVSRIIQFLENDSITYTIISVFSYSTYVISILMAISFSFIFSIVRFYKNLFTCEGYLSFTLPVTSSQHIVVKSVTAVSFNLITWIVIFISGCIITAGDMLVEIFKMIGYILKKLFELAKFHTVIIAAELAVLLLVLSFSSILLYYTFISIGQLFKKNRILAAVGAYFVYYIITQIISAIFSIIFIFLADTPAMEILGEYITLHPYVTIHTVLCGLILLTGVFSLIYFIVVRFIITKKLNLE